MPERHMAEHSPDGGRRRLRPAPLLFEPEAPGADAEHFFDLESIDDPGRLLERSTELAGAFRAAADRATEFQAMAAAQLADAEGQLALADPVGRGLADLLAAQREHLAQLLRLAARVHAERAGVGELGGEAVDRVGQAAALADLLSHQLEQK